MTSGSAETARVDIKSLTPTELEQFAVEAGFDAFRGRQLHEWMFRHHARSFDEMVNLPSRFRRFLESTAELRLITERERHNSEDGTCKILFTLASGRSVETVLIPDFNEDGAARRVTVCVSSQVGCAMGCVFCATGRMGFHQDLTASEIADQVLAMNRIAEKTYGRRVTNIVYMGMGEPLLNYDSVVKSVELLRDQRILGVSARRITLSTVGIAGRIRDLADDNPGVKLAVSLHAPEDAKRSSIMPVNRKAKTDLVALRSAIRYYHAKTGQDVTYEYCMFSGFNDTDADAASLAGVTKWAPSKVNLIMYNAVAGTGFEQTDESTLNRFIARLVADGVRVTVRRSRGQDIAAACGQLAAGSGRPSS
jgi:23S rRNA (adenine2503-C2)-methyltransferase